VAQPGALETSATNLNLDSANFIPFWPERLSGNNGPFNPFTEGLR
jgi:hypothetical protein